MDQRIKKTMIIKVPKTVTYSTNFNKAESKAGRERHRKITCLPLLILQVTQWTSNPITLMKDSEPV